MQLACSEPIAKGLPITHWSSQELARQLVADAVISAISTRTVRRILNEVDLQPHRTRYWKTARLDQFKHRAAQVLWCYAQAARLAQQSVWVVGVDEIPNLQVLQRQPIRRAIPGHLEQQEFEYTRHGTVTVLLFLIVHSGRMEVAILEHKNADHYVQHVELFRPQHPDLKGIFLVQDNDPSHTARYPQQYFAQTRRWWRPRYTPAHASWLNQAEILIHRFSQHYLKRTSGQSREECIQHIMAAEPEYNRLYAHPIEWTWSNQKMRRWFEKHSQ